MKARKGEMLIRVTDANDVYVPRFCYHDKLPVAANCRMCLVEVEKAPKPLPACATPVMEGMIVHTRSPKAIAAQKSVMEFLLINHPLDCPICDQGGECELQDLAMGYGRDISRFNERKRVVKDKNLGPLVSTDMTRCIHCTRCVRFGQDIAGFPELGTTGRGEHNEIGTYVEKSVDHELSGNIIDLCPVGALNSKPFRFRARAWEMTQVPLVSPHDGLGTNLYGHVLRGRLMRVVPRQNEAINECWISDRDRFSYEGIYSADRLQKPMVRTRDGAWRETDWQTALRGGGQRPCRGARRSASAFLPAPRAPSRNTHCWRSWPRACGTSNIDHRLRQVDFSGDAADPAMPSLGGGIAEVDTLAGAAGRRARTCGVNCRCSRIACARRRLRAPRSSFLNPAAFEIPVPGEARSSSCRPRGSWREINALLHGRRAARWAAVRGDRHGRASRHRRTSCATASRKAIWLGALALRHPQYAALRAAVQRARRCDRRRGGRARRRRQCRRCASGRRAAASCSRWHCRARSAGLQCGAMLAAPLDAYLLWDMEPGADTLQPKALRIAARRHLCGGGDAVT